MAALALRFLTPNSEFIIVVIPATCLLSDFAKLIVYSAYSFSHVATEVSAGVALEVRDFLGCFGPLLILRPLACWEPAVWLGGHTSKLTQQFAALPLSLLVHVSLKVSHRWDCPCTFPGLCTKPYTCRQSRVPVMCWSFSQPPVDISSQLFLLSFWPSACFRCLLQLQCQTVTTDCFW